MLFLWQQPFIDNAYTNRISFQKDAPEADLAVGLHRVPGAGVGAETDQLVYQDFVIVAAADHALVLVCTLIFL